MPSRRIVSLSASIVLLLAGGGVAAAQLTAGSAGRAGSTESYGANAARFLRLTGDRATTAKATNAWAPKAGKKGTPAADLGCNTDSPTDEATGSMPNGWCIRPAGTQVTTLRFPLGLTATNDGKDVLVTSDSGGLQGLTTIDTSSLAATTSPEANLFMGIAQAPNGTVYASGGNADRVFRFQVVGGAVVSQDLTEQGVFPVHNGLHNGPPGGNSAPSDGIPVTEYPANVLVDGNYLLVAGNLAEASGGQCPTGQSACSRVSVIDTKTDTVVARIPVGLDAYGLQLDAKNHVLYVSNWADEAGRGNEVGGTVSAIDVSDANPANWHESSYVVVGHHPSAIQLSADGTKLFVANTNDDSISILNVTNQPPTQLTAMSVAPTSGAQVGAHPDAFALSPDGSKLFVALAGLNAVQVLNGDGSLPSAGTVYIPTGYYPSALLVTGDANNYRLWVTNAKGTGPGQGVNTSVFLNGFRTQGTVSVIDVPHTDTDAQWSQWTNQVKVNDDFTNFTVNACDKSSMPAGVHVSDVLCPPTGQTSPIKHVVYIVTENKTFDQYFGDMPAPYNADPKWLLYGQWNTPNHHAMANQFGLGDNFFSDAEVSVTGHSFTSGAIATDHNERTWEADYDQGIRGTHGNGDPLRANVGGSSGTGLVDKAESELNDPEGGYIFEDFKNHGAVDPAQAAPGALSMAIYGEHTAVPMDDYQAKGCYNGATTCTGSQVANWKDGDIEYYDTCRAQEFISGKANDSALPPNFGPLPNPFYESRYGRGAPAGVATYGCQGRTLQPQFTLKHWEDVFNNPATKGEDVMPSFIYMSLPDNHTFATNVGSPTPQSMVADNDYAIGLITDALSHSPFWKNTVVVQTEDDTQISGDHVSALRDYLLVASPWSLHQGEVKQWGSMGALLRTIEQIFNLPPVALYDRLALPMHDIFRQNVNWNQPDLGLTQQDLQRSEYTAVVPAVPFALNQQNTPGAALSAQMDFRHVDEINEAVMNSILYADIRGWPLSVPQQTTPFYGTRRAGW